MTKDELRLTCDTLMHPKTIADCQVLLGKFIDCFFEIITKHHCDETETQAKADTKTVFQMFFTKALNIQNVLKGLEYQNDTFHLNNIIDPTILFSLTRGVFESLCAFEIVNMIPDTDDKKVILYNLYKLSGLNYAQRFNNSTASPEEKESFEREKLEIDECISLIKATSIYKSLRHKDKEKINKAIKDKCFQIKINQNSYVKKYGWGDIPSLFGVQHVVFKNAYTLFSLNAHPSYVSMSQFREMFNKGFPEYLNLSVCSMYYCFSFFSIFLADYIKLFPEIKQTYMSFSKENQILLNFYNKLFRGDSYSICDTWKELEG